MLPELSASVQDIYTPKDKKWLLQNCDTLIFLQPLIKQAKKK